MDETVPLVVCAVPECKTTFASWVGHRRCFTHSPCITEEGLYEPIKCTAQCYEMNNEESVTAQLASAGTSRMDEHLEQPLKRKKTFISGRIPKTREFIVKTLSCDICGTSFNDVPESLALERHYLDHFGLKYHLCGVCDKTFESGKQLIKHQSKHIFMTGSTCNVCGKAYSNIKNLKQHSLTHSSVAPHWCFVCGKAFTKKKLLETHFINHGGSLLKPHACSRCGKAYSNLRDLNTHELIHVSWKSDQLPSAGTSRMDEHLEQPLTGKTTSGTLPKAGDFNTGAGFVKTVSCDICGTSFNNPAESLAFETHYMDHFGVNNQLCVVCDKTFCSKKKLIQHQAKHMTESICNVCSEVFSSVQNLKQHSLTHSLVAPHWCFVCGKAFTKIELLKRHFINHGGSMLKPYTCSKCNSLFYSLKELNTHELIHISCSICGKDIRSNDLLKPYTCSKCNSLFSIETDYDTCEYHVSCSICQKEFTTKALVIKHTLEVHGDNELKRHRCDVCGADFTQESELTKHHEYHLKKDYHICKLCGTAFTKENKFQEHTKGNKCHTKGNRKFKRYSVFPVEGRIVTQNLWNELFKGPDQSGSVRGRV